MGPEMKKDLSGNIIAVDLKPFNKNPGNQFNNSVLHMEEEETAGIFQRAIPTRESIRCPRGSVVSFHNIEYIIQSSSGLPCKRLHVRKQILQGVNGVMKPGLNAILGPTGSGKSSLLDVLAARKDPSGLSGEVLIDGIPQPPNFKCISGYVVQDDVVMGTLTVKENLLFSAALRLPTSINFKEKEDRVNQVITELGLTKVANSRVGTELVRGVSGGERKRTNIGMELITEPPVLFLDEPTTGLDASTASAVLLLLKRLSKKGRTMILSIHQPRYSIFKLFDSLTLLAAGKMLYHGPATEAIEYFKTIGYECEPYNNPADFFLDVINGESTAVTANKDDGEILDTANSNKETNPVSEYGLEKQDSSLVDKLHEQYLKSKQYMDIMKELQKIETGRKNKQKRSRFMNQVTYATGFINQFHWVAKRSLTNIIRSPQSSIAQVVVSIILALIVGAIFFGVQLNRSGIQNRTGSLFFISTNQCFSSVSVIELFIRNKKLFIHEYTSGYYRLSAYFFALILGDLVILRTIPPIVFSCISYWMIGFQSLAGHFFFFMLTLILLSHTSTAMSLAISSGMDVVAIANLLITISFVLMLIFSGLLVNLPSVMPWLNWLKYFSIPRYGLTALEVNEFRGLYFCGDKPLNSTNSEIINGKCAKDPSQYIELCNGEEYLCSQGNGIDNWAMWENIVALICMTVIFLVITYVKLRLMKKFT
ncbi:ATP-binding cassette sub-family G member 2 isoform X1 [Microcaecilia unicolor]|uniref:ATP-binding cassette sub-family G member 2-like isoform X1 n=1 Tax=Microcaecilia unicolor TaxID=1415580 RepID=A0A6P7YCZ8_9AMPH|nr:ATP-binding cassette sub-family G member 2-like isoform X1 [Microcaecilia unicolor]XP_030060705.1 ATP-binding cassette sub-family G member 2-like isoform X1 [Microcaecilia unicolor]